MLRAQVDSELGELFQQFIVASASMPAEVYRSALTYPECEAELTMTENLIMNVRVPVFFFAIKGNLLSYGTDGTDGTVVEVDKAIVKLEEVLERLVKLAESKKNIDEDDILYELLLKLGLDLCVPIETRVIAGKVVRLICAGTLIVCLAESIASDGIERLALGIADWHVELAPAGDTAVVFRDSAFADHVAKTNLTAILEQRGIGNVRSV